MEVGKKYRIFWGEGNPNNKTIHVRAVVDEYQVVYKQWFSRKQRWCYSVRDMTWFDLLKERNVIKEVK